MCTKIKGIFEMNKMFNKNISIISNFVTYIANNQYDNTNDIYI